MQKQYLLKMLELSKHIECLLLSNNCVIVPRLGGFVAQYAQAEHPADEDCILPPRRTVGFNPLLTINDGLLVQSYMQTYEASYPETLRMINEAVDEIKAVLRNKGEFEMPGIGTIHLNMDGSYNFMPEAAGLLSPELYGLGTVKALAKYQPKSISMAKQEDTAPTDAESEENETESKRNYTFSINREIVNYAAAAVVALVLYFACLAPLPSATDNAAPMTASSLAERIMQPSAPSKAPAAATPVKPAAAEVAETPAAPEQPAAQAEETKQEQPYTIVLASAVSKKNAQIFVERLQAGGEDTAEVYVRGKMTRVIVGKFSTEKEAYEYISAKRKTNGSFSQAWILKL